MKRHGVTLIEVLVAIFITAIGLMSILALFPVGAMSMRHAIDNGRAVQAAQNAFAYVTAMKLTTDKNVISGNAFSQPDVTLPAAVSGGPSYPVYVDPIGTQGGGATFVQWVGSQKRIPRRVPSYVTDYHKMLTFFSIPDDMNFQPNGTPYVSPGGNIVEREVLYSWAYMLQRPNVDDTSFTTVTVAVYNRRPMSLSIPSSERMFNATGTAGQNLVSISWDPTLGQTQPSLKIGQWFVDCSAETTAQGIRQNGPFHAKFYRVVGLTVNPGTSPPTIDVETQSPLAFDVSAVLVLDNVMEVFERQAS
jgi:prepilin-type N-terminal cleavage/methylation domain-containing protein